MFSSFAFAGPVWFLMAVVGSSVGFSWGLIWALLRRCQVLWGFEGLDLGLYRDKQTNTHIRTHTQTQNASRLAELINPKARKRRTGS